MAGETKVEVLVEAIDKAAKVLDDLLGRLDKLDRAQSDSASAAKKVEGAQKQVGEAIDRAGKQAEQTTRQVDALDRSQEETERSSRRLETAQNQLAGSMGRMVTKAVALAAAYLSVRQAVDLVSDSYTAASGFETAAAQFEVLLGSAEAARQRMLELEDFGRTTPFELPGIVKASRTLETLTRGALSTGDQLRMVGDVAAGVEQPIEELSIWFGRLYDGIQSGRPVGEALMRFQEMGVITGEVRAKIERLQASGADSAEVWAVVTEAAGRYNGMMERMSSTAAGLNSNLADNIGTAKRLFGEGFLEPVKAIVRDINAEFGKLFDSGRIQAIGARFGAFISLLHEYWKAGRLDEIISLSIEAGIEKGAELGQAAMRRFFESDTGFSMTTIVASAFVKAVEVFLNAAFDAISLLALWISSRITAALRYAGQALQEGFAAAVNFLAAGVEKVINTFIAGMEKAINLLDRLPGQDPVNLGRVDVGRVEIDTKSYDDLLLEQQMKVVENAEVRRKAIADFFGELRDGIRGVAEDGEESVSRWAELMGEIDQKLEEFQAESGALGTSSRTTDGGDDSGEGTFNTDHVTRYIKHLEELQDTGLATAEVLEGAFRGVDNTIQGLWRGTVRWNEAILNVAGSIVGAVISAFSQMLAAWITVETARMIFNIGKEQTEATAKAGIMSASASAAAGIASGLTAAWTPAAVAASIATYGAAAGIGVASFSAAMMAGVAVGAAASLISGFLNSVLGAVGSAAGASVTGGGGGSAPGYASGSFTLDRPHMAWVGEEGEEWVSNARLTRRERPFFAALDRTQNIDAAFAMTRGTGESGPGEDTAIFHAVGSLQEGRKFRDRRAGRVELRKMARGEIAKYRNR